MDYQTPLQRRNGVGTTGSSYVTPLQRRAMANKAQIRSTVPISEVSHMSDPMQTKAPTAQPADSKKSLLPDNGITLSKLWEGIKNMPTAFKKNDLQQQAAKAIGIKSGDEYIKTLLPEQQDFFNAHPIRKAIVSNPISVAISNTGPAHDVFSEGLTAALTGQKPSEAITTGSAGKDKVLRTMGQLGSFFVPGGVGSSAGLVRAGAEEITTKLLPKAGNLISKSATGAIESLPYTAQQVIQERSTPGEAIKTAGTNALFGGGVEFALSGAGALIGKLKNAVVNPASVPPVEGGKAAKQTRSITAAADQSQLDVLERLNNIQKKSDEMFADTPLRQLEDMRSSAPAAPGNFNMASGVKKKPVTPKRAWDNFYNKTVDNTSFVGKAAGEEGRTAVDVARNAGGTVEYSIKNGLVNMEGKKVVDNGLQDVFNMPKGHQEALNNLLFHKHNIARMKQGKPLDPNISIGQSRQAIKDILQTYPELADKADTIRKTLDSLTDEWAVKSGLISPELRDVLRSMYPDYVPSYRILNGVDTISYKSRGMGPARIVNKAVGGDEPLQLLQESIPTLINKVVKASRKNEVYKTILDAARKNPKNGYATILEPVRQLKEVVEKKLTDSVIDAVRADGLEGIVTMSDKALEADPKLGYILTVMENGKPIRLSISEDLFKSLKSLDAAPDDVLQKALQSVRKYGTNPFKSLVTGYNPLFAVRNVARDIPTAYIQGTENNPLRFIKNLYDAGVDMAKGADRYQEFKALGGTGGNFFNIERGISPEGKLAGVKKVIGALNNATETLPRYAEYIGTLKRGGNGYANKLQGIRNAQEVTVNFGRHGDLTKALDAGIPYLNPAVQGLDKFVRTMKNPVAVAKSLGVVTVPTTAMYLINQAVDKEGYDKLDNRTKDTYFLIPMGDGQFIKIPKTREAGVLFGAFFERLYRLAQGQENAFKGFSSTIRDNFLPNNPITSNFFYPMSQVIGDEGKDFAGRDIVPQSLRGYSPRYQYDNQTSEIAKTIGNLFNISPKKIDYLAKSYLGIVGQAGIPLTTKSNYTGLKGVVTSMFKADSAYNNEVQNEFYNNLRKLQTAKNDSSMTGQAMDENILSGMYRANDDMSTIRGIMKQIESDTNIDNNEKQKLLRDYQKQLIAVADQANKMVKSKDNSIMSKYSETRGTYYPESSFSYNGQKIIMDPEEYESFRKTASDYFTRQFNSVLLSRQWANLSDLDKDKIIQKMLTDANSIAKGELLRKRGLLR